MLNERSLIIVRDHQPLAVPPGAAAAGLTTAIAVVLSTSRQSADEMVLDHELWLACMQGVAPAVGAASVHVFAASQRRWLERWRRPRLGDHIAGLSQYGSELLADQDPEQTKTDLWETILWKNGDRLCAAASREGWYAVGGPDLYHDSYTTSIMIAPQHAEALVRSIAESADRAGGAVDRIVEKVSMV